MPQVQVSLGAVRRHEYLAVLERAHRARIHIQVRIEFHHADFEPAGFENCPEGSSSNSLTQRRNHTTGDKYKSRHELIQVNPMATDK